MKTELPNAFTSSASPRVRLRAPESPIHARRRIITAVVVLLFTVFAAIFWLVSGGRAPTTKLTINGRPVWVPGDKPTLGAALEAGRVQPRDGALLSAVTKRVIDPHAIPAEVLVDGTKAATTERVKRGDRIVVRDGTDTAEPVTRRHVQGALAGLPPVEDRIWVAEKGATEEVEVGERSGEIVSRRPGPAAAPARAETGKVVALTFDDGPDARWTPEVLQILKEENVKATFCIVGYLAQRFPQLVKQTFDAGHTICDHTVHHILRLDLRPHPQIIDEVVQGADILRGIIGQDPPFYRPPGGSLNQDIIDTARGRGMRVLKWSMDSGDFNKPPAPVLLARILEKAGPGAVILMHDGGGDRSQTVGMLRQLIRDLKARGFTFSNWQ